MESSTPLLETVTLVGRERIAPGFWLLSFRGHEIARRAQAAHYVAVDVPGEFSARLPLGIWTASEGNFTLLFREWGDRTKRLAGLADGTEISMIGPLGNVFTIPPAGSRAIVAAGGVGIVPFWLLTRQLHAAGVETTIIFGARTREMLCGIDALRELGPRVSICTDDGSAGERGTVMNVLSAVLRDGPAADMLYGCGPAPMLQALCEHANELSIPCQISMEETFGCSMGTCWGCVVPVRRGSQQGTHYPRAPGEKRPYDLARVCIDGTVFWAADVLRSHVLERRQA